MSIYLFRPLGCDIQHGIKNKYHILYGQLRLIGRDLAVMGNTMEGIVNLFKTRSDAVHQDMCEVDKSPSFLSHKDEPVDFYRKYNDDNFTPNNVGSDSRNLFDDSNVEDQNWLAIVRNYLASARH